MRRRYLSRLASIISHRPWLFVAGGVLLAGVAGWHAAQALDFKTSRNDLIGRDSEYWRLYSEYTREFRAEEDYLIVVEGDRPNLNRTVVDALAQALVSPANNPHAADSPAAQQFVPDDVFYRVNFDALQDRFLYFLSVDDLAQIRDSLKDFKQLLAILEHDPELDTFFNAMNQMLDQMASAPEPERRKMEAFLSTVSAILTQLGELPAEEQDAELLSPWASAFFSDQMLSEAEQQLKWKGYHVFRNGRTFVILIHPKPAAGNKAQAVHAATIAKIRRIIAEVRTRFPDVTIGLTGEPVLDHDEMTVSERDARKAVLLTLALVSVLFALSFREVQRPLLAVGCIVLVVAMSMGWAAAWPGHLNIITVTFAVMIVGLGIDLGIQFIARYEEELTKGLTRRQAIAVAVEQTGPSMITAGVTNAAAFFAMGLSGFRGVIELGVIAGGGMLIATGVMLTVLPALLLLARRKHETTHIPAQATATRFEQLLLRRPYAVLIVCGALTGGALLVGWRVRFDYNVLNLQSRRLDSVATELRLLEADAQSTIFAAVVCANMEEARALHAALEALPTVGSVASIVPLIPERQQEKMALIRAIQKELGEVGFGYAEFEARDVEKLQRTLGSMRLRAQRLLQAAEQRGDGPSQKALSRLLDAVRSTLAKLEAASREQLTEKLAIYQQRFFADLEAQLYLMAEQNVRAPMTLDDVPLEARRMLIGKTGKFLLRVFPKENIWEREALVQFVRDVQTVAPKATGTPLGLYEFVDILQRGYIKAALWAFLVIAILVFIDFRGGYATPLTLLPLVMGMIWMVGAMSVLGIPFNPANILVLPLMVGIGVAYGIYVVQRYREDGQATFYGKSTGRAVILSALTTIVAFGSLIIGAHRGIRSLGMLMMIGIASCLVAGLVLLPALLEVARRKGWKV
jgi:hopanoid biosynthesis associated RND transporter like protein HpnN